MGPFARSAGVFILDNEWKLDASILNGGLIMKQYALSALGALLLFFTGSITASTQIRHTQDKQVLLNLIATEKNLVVKFERPNCPFCVYLSPIFNTVAQQCPDNITFLSVMIPDADREWYKAYFGFTTVPMVVYYKDGKKDDKRSHGSNNRGISELYILNNLTQMYGI